MTGAEFWQQHGFILVGADAVRRGLGSLLLRRLAAEKYPAVAGRVLTTDPEMIDDLYADLIAGQWQTWRYRLVDAAFRLGPAIALICRLPAGVDEPYQLLQQRKGHQHPGRAQPGTIRHDLASVNAVLNLLHTADGPAESAREALAFGLTPDDVTGDEGADLAYRAALAEPQLIERRDFTATLAGVRARVLAAAWSSLSSTTRKAIAAEFSDRLLIGSPTAGARLADILADDLSESLLTVLRCDFTPQWRDRVRIGQATAQLQRYAVELDDWEELVLTTSLHFPPSWGDASVDDPAASDDASS